MQRRIISLALSLILFLSLLGGISFVTKTENVIADEVDGIEISVLKVWDDYNDLDEIRPDSVEVTLYQNNQKTDVKATLSANNNWYYKYNTLVAEKDNNGDKISYTWKCDDIDDYERYEDNLDNMYIITDVHHISNPKVNSVVLQKFNENDEFFDDCNMILKNKSGNTLITWTTGNDSSINTHNSGLSASMNNDGSLVVDNIPEGEYIYREVSPKTGYTDAGQKEFKIEKGTHNYSFNWYTDIQDAVTDANNLNNNNADCYRDDDNCKVGMFLINGKAHFILVKNISTSTITLNVNTIFDLNSKTLTQYNNANFIYMQDLKIIDGYVNLNTRRGIIAVDINNGNIFNTTGNLIINNVEINNNSSEGNIYTINHCGDDLLFNNVKVNTKSSSSINYSGISSLNLSGFYNCDNVELNDCEFISEATSNSFSANISGINVASNDNIKIQNSKIIAKTNGNATARAINLNDQEDTICDNVEIKNCELYSESSDWSEGIDCDNGSNILLSNNIITVKGGSLSRAIDVDCVAHNSSIIQSVNADDNNINCYCSNPTSDGYYSGFHLPDQNKSLHLKSGRIYLEPVANLSDIDSNGHCDGIGNGIMSYGTIVIDESKGSNTVIGSNNSIWAGYGSNATINGGLFKSPCHIICAYNGSSGSFVINGGQFICNNNEYSSQELNGIHDYGAIYLMGSTDENDYWDCNIKNAIIQGGTYGIVFKYYSPTCHIYNSNISSRSHNIRLDDNIHNRNIYCYIESGTEFSFSSEQSDMWWLDRPFINGYGKHIIDNRIEQQTSTQVETTTQGGE